MNHEIHMQIEKLEFVLEDFKLMLKEQIEKEMLEKNYQKFYFNGSYYVYENIDGYNEPVSPDIEIIIHVFQEKINLEIPDIIL
jgi:hypothetical protein